jgi:hypothetical protein
MSHTQANTKPKTFKSEAVHPAIRVALAKAIKESWSYSRSEHWLDFDEDNQDPVEDKQIIYIGVHVHNGIDYKEQV